jgi:hypothetical protein
MRKLTFVVAALVALTATSYAVAHGIEGAKNVKVVAATFTANAGSTTSRTCTTSDNKTIVVTDAKYTGAATGDADLTGPITLRARSVVNTTDGVGTVNGNLRIDAAGKDTQASYSTVFDHGTIAGLAAGRSHESKTGLVANLSATFDPATGFTNGKLGGGTTGGSAVEVGTGGCKPAQETHQQSSARGPILTLSATSITVAGLTCNIPSDKSADILAKFHQNDAVEIRCAFANNANTLTSISSGKHH